MKKLFILLLISSPAIAKDLNECIEDAINASIANKILAALELSADTSGSSCGYISKAGLIEISESRDFRIKYKIAALIEYKKSSLIDLNPFIDFDENSPGKTNENGACAYLQKKVHHWIVGLYKEKFPALKSCPIAVDAFRDSLRQSDVINSPMIEVCPSVKKAEDEMNLALKKCS